MGRARVHCRRLPGERMRLLYAIGGAAGVECAALPDGEREECVMNNLFALMRGAALLAMFELGEFALSELPDLVPIASVHEPDARHSALLDGRLRSMIDFHERTTEFYRSFDRQIGRAHV